jgi:hypothetical protein
MKTEAEKFIVRGENWKESDRDFVTCGCGCRLRKGNKLQDVKEVDKRLEIAKIFVYNDV